MRELLVPFHSALYVADGTDGGRAEGIGGDCVGDGNRWGLQVFIGHEPFS